MIEEFWSAGPLCDFGFWIGGKNYETETMEHGAEVLVRQSKSSQRDLKFEARNPKSETNSNDQKQMQCSKQTRSGFLVLDFPGLEFILAPVCFEFRASDFGFVSPGAWHDNIFVTSVGPLNVRDEFSDFRV